MKKLAIILILILVVVASYSAVIYYMVSKTPLTYTETDINKDGFVSLSEIVYVSNFAVRTIIKNGQECIEYYAQKDGLALKVECN